VLLLKNIIENKTISIYQMEVLLLLYIFCYYYYYY